MQHEISEAQNSHLYEILQEEETDLACITETWMEENDMVCLSQLISPTYPVLLQPHTTGQVEVLLSSSMNPSTSTDSHYKLSLH